MTEPAKRRSTCDTMDESMDEELGIINVDIAALPLTSTLFDLANANLIRGEIAQHLDLQSLGRFARMDGMFFDTASFNIDTSSWSISSVDNMEKMFFLATAYNQNLCAWVDEFPYGSATNIFVGSGCNVRGDPHVLQQGPFCASSCK